MCLFSENEMYLCDFGPYNVLYYHGDTMPNNKSSATGIISTIKDCSKAKRIPLRRFIFVIICIIHMYFVLVN